ncbi:MAG: hypothetical protein ACPGJV_04700 [Bacteriovoracaceae bacterium]
MHKFILIFTFLFSFQTFSRLLGTGLEISVSGDMVHNQGLNEESEADDKLTMRGAEIILYAPIDHNFDGVLSAAAHDEGGETMFELHELFIATSKIVPRSNIRVGQFFLSLGRLNRFHQHDWPFTRAPLVHRTFFDDEGVFDTGLEYNYLFPTAQTFNLTLGVTSGYRYGHSHTTGSKPKVPTHYARLSTFDSYSSTSGSELGVNFLGRTDAQDNEMKLVGIDLTTKFREGKILKYLLQSEVWFKNERDSSDDITEQVGLYLFNEFATGEQTSVGLRLDGFKDLSKINALTEKKINNITYGGLAQATYRSSEFAKIRASLGHEFEREEGQTTSKDTRVVMQFIFIIGSHPAHEF